MQYSAPTGRAGYLRKNQVEGIKKSLPKTKDEFSYLTTKQIDALKNRISSSMGVPAKLQSDGWTDR